MKESRYPTHSTPCPPARSRADKYAAWCWMWRMFRIWRASYGWSVTAIAAPAPAGASSLTPPTVLICTIALANST